MNPLNSEPINCSTQKHQTYVKKRKRATAEQLAMLEDIFRVNITPNGKLRRKLAEQLNMNERSVQIWFQNKRAKVKYMRKRAQTQLQQATIPSQICHRYNTAGLKSPVAPLLSRAQSGLAYPFFPVPVHEPLYDNATPSFSTFSMIPQYQYNSAVNWPMPPYYPPSAIPPTKMSSQIMPPFYCYSPLSHTLTSDITGTTGIILPESSLDANCHKQICPEDVYPFAYGSMPSSLSPSNGELSATNSYFNECFTLYTDDATNCDETDESDLADGSSMWMSSSPEINFTEAVDNSYFEHYTEMMDNSSFEQYSTLGSYSIITPDLSSTEQDAYTEEKTTTLMSTY